MTFGQLIQCNIRNIFLEKPYIKYDGGLVRVPFLENPNWGYLWINSPKVHTICFYCIPGWTLSNILTLRCSPLSYTSYKADFKSKKFPELVSLPHFLYFFKENCISKYSIDQISLSGCLYFVKYGTISVL